MSRGSIGKFPDALEWYDKIFEIQTSESEAIEISDELFTNKWLDVDSRYLNFHDKYSDVQKIKTSKYESEYEKLFNQTGEPSKAKQSIEASKQTAEPPAQLPVEINFIASGIFLRKARGTDVSRQAQRVLLCFDRSGTQAPGEIIDDLLSDDAGMDCVVSFVDGVKPFNEDDLRQYIGYPRQCAYQGLGDMNRVIADWEAAVKLAPDNTALKESLEKARQVVATDDPPVVTL